MKKIPAQKLFRGGAETVFSLVEVFSRTRFPCHFAGGIPARAFPPAKFLRRDCPAARQRDWETVFSATS